MAGHNKWSKIKHKKAVTDAVKSKIYSKYNKLIQVAIKEAGGDVNSPNVQRIIEKAKADNVPKDNIERAIKKATGADASQLTEIVYEGYGPGGVGFLIKVVIDNTNRSATEIRTIFTKNGGSFASPGAVSWAFTKNQDNEWIPNEGTEIEVDDETKEKNLKLLELFEENDDVVDVFTNLKD